MSVCVWVLREGTWTLAPPRLPCDRKSESGHENVAISPPEGNARPAAGLFSDEHIASLRGIRSTARVGGLHNAGQPTSVRLPDGY